MPQDDEDDRTGYSLAEPSVPVSSANACSTQLDDKKRAAVKSYINTLGPKLRERYGKQPHYTPQQVHDTALANGLSIDYLCWAYMMHCSPTDFAMLHSAAGEVCDADAMRAVVGAAFFAGHTDFVSADVTEAIVSGTAEAVATGTGSIFGWLGEINWSGLLDNLPSIELPDINLPDL